MPTLYHHPLLAPSRKVRLAMHEKRIAFTEQVLDPWMADSPVFTLNPAGELPILEEDNGQRVMDATAICEYLEETQPAVSLIGKSPAERAETRRLVGWFDNKFARDVSDYTVGEKLLKRVASREAPDSRMLKVGRENLHTHMHYIGWLADHRRWLAGDELTIADLAAAAQLSLIDYIGDVPWDDHPQAKEWYVRLKSRPSFRHLLKDTVPGVPPAPIYADLDF